MVRQNAASSPQETGQGISNSKRPTIVSVHVLWPQFVQLQGVLQGTQAGWQLEQRPSLSSGRRRVDEAKSLVDGVSQGPEWHTRLVTGEPGTLVIRGR